MIFKQENDKYIRIDYNGNEQEFVDINPGYIFIEDIYVPSSYSGIYIYDEDNSLIPSPEEELQAHKNQLLLELSDYFDNYMCVFNWFTCSFGFPVDNRRYGSKNDRENVQSLIDLGQEPVYFKDHNDTFQSLTIEQLKTLKQEMIQNGLSLYQWIFNKQQEIMNATSDNIDLIEINYEFS